MTSAPLLIVIAGPARGRSLQIEGSVTIGRDEQNTIAISDPALSRRHCEVTLTGDGVVLRDCGSRNGVFVNGVPITQQALADGDLIRIGDSALRIVVPGTAAGASATFSTTIDDRPPSAASTVSIRADVRADRSPGDLAILLRLSEALQRATSEPQLYEMLLRHALEAVPAEAATILVSEAPSATFVIAATKATTTPVTVSSALAARCIAERVALLTSDDAASSSPQAPSLRAAACAPLLTAEALTNVLCLTRTTTSATFTRDDLQMLAAMGSLGGLALDRVRQMQRVEHENLRLREDAAIDHGLVGESAAMQTVYKFISRAAPTDSTVLIRGESGTGKELVARAIHANSARARGPFVAINCAALPEALLESELFGHERGAFTGALSQQRGRLELADRGSVFLDEIGELAPALQAKLLRVLQDHVVERLGARRGVPIDVRVIAATNMDLEAGIAEGRFRKDLFYRLNVISVETPPLRERREDLPLLAAYFVRQHASRCKRAVKGISPAAKALLTKYDWPGNVRELSNAIERAIVLGSSDVILEEDLPETLLDTAVDAADVGQGFHAQVAAAKRDLIRDALQRSGGNVARAARDLGLQPTYLHRLLRNLGVREMSQ